MPKCVNVRLSGPELHNFSSQLLKSGGELSVSGAQKLLAPGHRPDVPGREAEPENDPRCEGRSPEPDGISFAKFLHQPPSFDGSVNKPMVITKGGGTEEGDRSSDEKLRANQET
ncbi:MAG: hypothetical protein ACI8P0_001235 [Planctomycetaceae bacterium]|jgi:hypothetical protein